MEFSRPELEWVAFPFSRGSSQPRDRTQVSHIAGRRLNLCATREALTVYEYTEIRLIIFFAAEVGEALYSQQKQDWELTVAQIMNCLLQVQT